MISYKNKEQVFKQDWCGCSYCVAVFNPNRIVEWIDGGATGICPDCGVDSIVAYNPNNHGTIEKFIELLRQENKRTHVP